MNASYETNTDINEVLAAVHEATGVSRSRIIRALVLHYASGNHVPGLPRIESPTAKAKQLGALLKSNGAGAV